MGGANDIYRNETSEAAEALKKSLEELKDTNVIFVNPPHRHDLMQNSIVNEEIIHATTIFSTICSKYKNVSVVNTLDYSRNLHTTHGQHLSFLGKQTLTKTIACICSDKLELLTSSPKPNESVNTQSINSKN